MRLIDADALKAKLEKKTDMNDPRWSFDSMMLAKIMISILDEVPTVEERKHGRWVRHNNIIACSECIWDMYWEEEIAELKYCPNCGAIMENNGDDDDE